MDRTSTTSPHNRHGSNHHYHNAEPSPPWEQRSIAQVPYMAPDSPPLTQAERHRLQSVWASRENGSHERSGSYASASSHDHASGRCHHCGVRSPASAPPQNTSPPPMAQEASKIGPGPRSPPQFPAFAKGPPSPPDSARLSHSSISKSASPHHSPRLGSRPSITAMPGTMSAREKSLSPHRERPLSQDHPAPVEQDPVPFGKRVKHVLRDMFKRTPVDTDSFERIRDRHWAEDDSPM